MRRILMLSFLALAFALAACGDDDGEWVSEADDAPADTAEAVDDATDEPNPTLEPEPSPTPALDAGADQDPRDVLIALTQDPEDPDLELVYQYLPERFRVLEFDEAWVRSVAQGLPRAPWLDELGGFKVEEYEGYSLVRSSGLWHARWVFVLEDDEWRWDPGDQTLITAAGRYQVGPDEGFSYGMGPDDGLQIEWESDLPIQVLPQPVRGSVMGVGVHENGIDVVTEWEIAGSREPPDREQIVSHLLSDTIIPVDHIRWHADGESGEVEVRWTNGGYRDGEILLHGWPSRELAEEVTGDPGTYPFLRYGFTLRLLDVPEDADEFVLQLNEVRVGPFRDERPEIDGEVFSYKWEFYFPSETTNPILAGEAPEHYDAAERPAEEAPALEQDLPPAPDLSEILLVSDIEYSTDDESTEARILLDPGETHFEFPGPAQVTWDDGAVSEASPMVQGGEIEVTAERNDSSQDVEVVEIRFEQLVRSLETDESATIEQARIATMWGAFLYSVRPDEVSIKYQPTGQRWIRGMTIHHDDGDISFFGSGAQFDEEFRPQSANLETNAALDEVLEDIPLVAAVEVWQAERDAVIEIE